MKITVQCPVCGTEIEVNYQGQNIHCNKCGSSFPLNWEEKKENPFSSPDETESERNTPLYQRDRLREMSEHELKVYLEKLRKSYIYAKSAEDSLAYKDQIALVSRIISGRKDSGVSVEPVRNFEVASNKTNTPKKKKSSSRGCCGITFIFVVIVFVIAGLSRMFQSSSNVAQSTKAESSSTSKITNKLTPSPTKAPTRTPSKVNLSKEKAVADSGEYAFITTDDLDKYIANMTGQKIYTVITVDNIDSEKVQANIGDGLMFQTFNTNKDYSGVASEGDVVAVYGTVGESQSFLGAHWTEVNDSAIFAVGAAAINYRKTETDSSLSEFLTATEETAKTTPLTEAEYKSLCQSYSYNDILRNPDSYKKKYAVLSGTVDQIVEGVLNLYTTIYIPDSDGNKWSCNYNYSSGETRVLEGDYVTVYGQLDGTTKATTLLGKQVTMPYIEIEYFN